MNTPKKALKPAAVAGLMILSLLTPIVALGAVSAGAQTQSQLTILISAAQTSSAYAHSAVDEASAHGLAVGSAQAQLSQGDSLLATAQADAQSGSNIDAGIQAVQEAMRDYTFASASASVALGNAGLASSVDYSVSEAAVAEVNETASILVSVTAQACGSAGAGSSAFVNACADVRTQVAIARTRLSQAASILAQANGGLNANFDYSQVMSLVTSAREDVNATQSDLVTIAAYTYSQRGEAFYANVIVPASAKANSTVRAEKAALGNLTQFQSSFDAYTSSQASAASKVNSSVLALASAISQVNVGDVSTSIGTAQSAAGQVKVQMSALLSIAGIVALSNVVADINACTSAATTYDSNIATAQTWSEAYTQTQLQGFSGYVTTGTNNAAAVQAAGNPYVTDCNKVITDLAGLLIIPGVTAIYNVLVALQISGTVGGVNAALNQETSAMVTVNSDIASLSSAASLTSLAVPAGIVSTASSVSTRGSAFLNATAAAALAEVSSSVQTQTQVAGSFITAAKASTQTSVGTFATAVASVSSADHSLTAQTQTSLGVVAAAAAYMGSATQARIVEAASGRAEASHALSLFSGQNVSDGAAAMVQAYFELQAAASISA
jgi:hypothetical protein